MVETIDRNWREWLANSHPADILPLLEAGLEQVIVDFYDCIRFPFPSDAKVIERRSGWARKLEEALELVKEVCATTRRGGGR